MVHDPKVLCSRWYPLSDAYAPNFKKYDLLLGLQQKQIVALRSFGIHIMYNAFQIFELKYIHIHAYYYAKLYEKI